MIDGGAPPASTSHWRPGLVNLLDPLAARADALARMPLFEALPWAEIEAAVERLDQLDLVRGTRLTVQGRPPSRLWLVVAGEALVSADARPLRVIGPGAAAGVAAMLYSVRSRETTIALKPMTVLAAAPAQFAELVQRDPMRRLLTALAGDQLRARRLSRPR